MTPQHEPRFRVFRNAPLIDNAPPIDAVLLDDVLRYYCPVAELHGWADVVRHIDAARSALLERMAPADRARAEAA